MPKLNVAARKRARRFSLQAIYQWQINPEAPQIIAEQFLQQPEMVSVDKQFFETLLLGVVKKHDELDPAIEPLLLKSQSIIQAVEWAILRIGAYELKYCLETPYRIIVNEAIELAKTFSTPGAHKYVNGILHALAKKYREHEVNAMIK